MRFKLKTWLYCILLLVVFVPSCGSIELEKELAKSQELTIRLLLEKHDKQSRTLDLFYVNDPKAKFWLHEHYLTLDSTYTDLVFNLKDSLTDENALSIYQELKTQIQVLLSQRTTFFKNFYNKELSNYQELVEQSENRIAQQLSFLTPDEIHNSIDPTQKVLQSILLNLEVFTDELIASILSSDDWFGVPFQARGEMKNDTAFIELTSRKFYKKTKEAYFILDHIEDSKGNVIMEFGSENDDVIWNLSIPNAQDSIYSLSGSIFSKHTKLNEIVECDTFQHKKVKIDWKN